MTTAEQRAAFIRAICEEPFNDTPRMAYMDWLMEQTDRPVLQELGHMMAHFFHKNRVLFLDTYATTSADWLAHGPILVTQHPIIKARIADKEPWEISSHKPSHFAWFLDRSEDGMVDSEDIPDAWFVRLASGRYWTTFGDSWVGKRYPTVADAHTALSHACIDWARAEAGLPKLDWSKKR